MYSRLFCSVLSAVFVLVTAALATAQSITFTRQPIAIDGKGTEMAWGKANWLPLNNLWAGTPTTASDFSGRLKYLTDGSHLYVLAEITDDTLVDTHANPEDYYWDDDCLEIFIDSDASGGIHQYNHTAFAYHISLAGRALDMGENHLPVILDNHIVQKRTTKGSQSTWEIRFNLHTNAYKHGKHNPPMVLKHGSKIRLAGAYCDNDHSAQREHFYGTMPIPGTDKNRAWIDASLFPIYTVQ